MQNIETTTIGNCDYIIPLKWRLGTDWNLYGYQCLTKKEYDKYVEVNQPAQNDRFFIWMLAWILVFIGIIWLFICFYRFFSRLEEDFKE